MKNKKGFTFVELLLVMLVLGIIISLTLPIIKGIKDDDDIHRAYMKKANQDVSDAMNMISIKENKFKGMYMLEGNKLAAVNANYSYDAKGLRNLFNAGLGGLKCGECSEADRSKCYLNATNNLVQCIISAPDFKVGNTAAGIKTNGTPGIVLGGKPVMIFQLNDYNAGNQVKCSYNNTGKSKDEKVYGCLFIDMNKDKGPNEFCKDRYKFVIYNDRIAMETDKTKGGCSFVLGE